MLTRPENLAVLADLPGRWTDVVHDRRPAFGIPALFDLLEAGGWDDTIRIKGQHKLHKQISWLAKRGFGRPPHRLVRRYTNFRYRAKSWSGRAESSARSRSV